MKGVLTTLLALSLFVVQGVHADEDKDKDGVLDIVDLCLDTDDELEVDDDGCSAAQVIEQASAEALSTAADSAIVAIDTIVPVNDDSEDDLNKAMDKLVDALEKLAEPDVEDGIKKIAEAVKYLMKAGEEGESDVAGIISALRAVVQEEVQAAIDAAQAACTAEPDPDDQQDCQKKVDEANEEVVEANLEIDMGRFDYAIKDFKYAWKKTQYAFEITPPEFPADEAPTLVIAYINVDGDPGFGAGDILVAKIVDTAAPAGLSAGDTVVTDKYPTSTNFPPDTGDFTITEHTIDSISRSDALVTYVLTGAGAEFYFQYGPVGSAQAIYLEIGSGATSIVHGVDGFRQLTINPGSPSAPTAALVTDASADPDPNWFIVELVD